jgi:thioredoxin-related protein
LVAREQSICPRAPPCPARRRQGAPIRLAERLLLSEWFPVKTVRLALLAWTLGALGLGSAQAEANWISDFPKAQEEAKVGHKLLLLDFTGSDWCIWCLKLHREVFSKTEFEEYAKENLVLMKVDFPRAKSLSSEVRKQNMELAQRYQVEGFPTIVVLNGDGRQVGLLGYLPGGPGAFIDELKKLQKR